MSVKYCPKCRWAYIDKCFPTSIPVEKSNYVCDREIIPSPPKNQSNDLRIKIQKDSK